MDKIYKQGMRLFIALLCMILLSACSHMRKKDGPPNFYVDESKVPNAVPKVEPLAKYGNMPSYKVFGKRYYTMKSSQNFEQVGIASWYGTQFHAQRTSSGERYDMLGMTAAHKTLPLPTYLEVTNLKNHRTIIVKVNDRGPFESNRILDLSYVAAKKLGMMGKGTALVKIKAINPRTWNIESDPILMAREETKRNQKHHTFTPIWQAHHKPAPAALPFGTYLQVGAFKDKQRALKLQQRLARSLGTPVQIAPNKHLYLVKVGPLHNQDMTQDVTRRLKRMGITWNKHLQV